MVKRCQHKPKLHHPAPTINPSHTWLPPPPARPAFTTTDPTATYTQTFCFNPPTANVHHLSPEHRNTPQKLKSFKGLAGRRTGSLAWDRMCCCCCCCCLCICMCSAVAVVAAYAVPAALPVCWPEHGICSPVSSRSSRHRRAASSHAACLGLHQS